MKTINIRKASMVRLSGRFDAAQQGFPMLWSGSSAELLAQATTLEVQISCAYRTHKPYLSFEVDGLRAQTLAPLPGKQWYNVFLHLDSQKAHHVRIVKETQPFPDDGEACVTLLKLRTDGELKPLPPCKRKIEFIGDSITSGEGGRGPASFMEWVPMVFCASENYARLTADALDAQYQVVSQSGWGAVCGWDNNPQNNLPSVYDFVCRPQTKDGAPFMGCEKPYDFSFRPDTVVIALGANDRNAVHGEAYTDPVTGKVSKLSDSEADIARFTDACADFLLHLHQKNPQARLVWISFIGEGPIPPAIRRAVERVAAQGVPAEYSLPIDLSQPTTDPPGSRSHPGPETHRRIAQALTELLK